MKGFIIIAVIVVAMLALALYLYKGIFLSKQYKMPDSYKGLVTQKKYNLIMKLSLEYFKEQNYEVVGIAEGEIILKIGEENAHIYLDNLVRRLVHVDEAEMKYLISEHHSKFSVKQEAAIEFFKKDFEYAKPLLRVLIKPEVFDPNSSLTYSVRRMDLPNTFTHLIIEYEGAFYYLMQDEIAEWGLTANELIDIGISNTPANEIEVREYQLGEEYNGYIFLSGDFAASLMLDIENRAEFAVGSFGSLIAVPAKGTAFAFPLNGNEAIDIVALLAPIAGKFFNEDPGNINTEMYWYYKGEYQVFPTEADGDKITVSLPTDLEKIIYPD